MSIATATHTGTRLTRLVDIIEATPERTEVSWTLGQRVTFDRSGRGIGPARDWVLGDVRIQDDDGATPVRRKDEPTRGAVELAAWLRDNKKTQVELANKLCIAASVVNRWFNTQAIPKPSTLRRIELLTGVKVEAWR